ncbi:putative sulfate exporter family transporter [Sinomonas notoginsengisoli]|uniref:YeiH family protein n=1 Tax=Sinomonas notoginsengisoli TaxID=1457311 RepID=UPI001F1A834B|nr:putative sulfate exporter family transporter [Sinomonas notoginsengisoli]
MAAPGPATPRSTTEAAPRSTRQPLSRAVPGLAVALTGAAVAVGAAALVPGLSPLLVAIVLGIALRNLGLLSARLALGLAVAARVPLRAGIVVLGLQLSLRDLAALGWGIPAIAATVVVTGILATVLLGRLLRVPARQALLVACGFSICGAAAVAGVESVVDADEEDTVTAVALVVLFGTLMIPAVPLLAGILGLDTRTTALWAGSSVHEVAQVVAVGGLLGSGALALAITVKLARVLMLAPVAAVLSWRQRRTGSSGGKRPPIVPLFVLGFVGLVAARTAMPIPSEVLSMASALQTFLLTTAMLALGTGVQIRSLVRRGGKTLALAGGSTLMVGAVGLAGALIVA